MKQASIAARLNRLPIIKTHKWSLAIIGIGTFFEIYDMFLAGVIGGVLTKKFHLGPVLLPAVLASGFVGMFFGAIFLGNLADRVGRKAAFFWTLSIYSFFSIVAAFSTNAPMLIILRFLAGIGLGGEIPLASTYLGDLVPPQYRGYFVSWAWVIGYCAVSVSGFLARGLVPLHPLGVEGWRWIFIIGGLGAFIVWALQTRLPESPRWLEAVGRYDEADAITKKMEQEALARYGRGSLPAPKDESVKVASKPPFSILFSKRYAGRTVMLWVFQFLQTVGFYGFGLLGPMVLASKGFTIVHSLTYVALVFIGYPLGALVSLFIIEKMDRKWLIVGSAFLMGAFGLLLGFSNSPAAILIFGFLFTTSCTIFTSGFLTFMAEIYPTYARGTAASSSYAISRLGAAVTPFILLPILHKAGAGMMFTVVAAVMLAIIIDIGFFAPATTGLDLEEISVIEEAAESAVGVAGT